MRSPDKTTKKTWSFSSFAPLLWIKRSCRVRKVCCFIQFSSSNLHVLLEYYTERISHSFECILAHQRNERSLKISRVGNSIPFYSLTNLSLCTIFKDPKQYCVKGGSYSTFSLIICRNSRSRSSYRRSIITSQTNFPHIIVEKKWMFVGRETHWMC